MVLCSFTLHRYQKVGTLNRETAPSYPPEGELCRENWIHLEQLKGAETEGQDREEFANCPTFRSSKKGKKRTKYRYSKAKTGGNFPKTQPQNGRKVDKRCVMRD